MILVMKEVELKRHLLVKKPETVVEKLEIGKNIDVVVKNVDTVVVENADIVEENMDIVIENIDRVVENIDADIVENIDIIGQIIQTIVIMAFTDIPKFKEAEIIPRSIVIKETGIVVIFPIKVDHTDNPIKNGKNQGPLFTREGLEMYKKTEAIHQSTTVSLEKKTI